MSVYNYIRCHYESTDTKVQCDCWFDSSSYDREKPESKYCIIHRDAISTELAVLGVNKETYIETRDKEAKFCYEMSFEELEKHISEVEKVIEFERTKLLTARAVKSDKLEKMTDDERKERRKIKTPSVVLEPLKPKKVSVKDNPVKYLMQQMTITEKQARTMLGLEG